MKGYREDVASFEVVKALQLLTSRELDSEKAARQRDENQWEERERHISMLSVDYCQIQQQLSKWDEDHR